MVFLKNKFLERGYYGRLYEKGVCEYMWSFSRIFRNNWVRFLLNGIVSFMLVERVRGRRIWIILFNMIIICIISWRSLDKYFDIYRYFGGVECKEIKDWLKYFYFVYLVFLKFCKVF